MTIHHNNHNNTSIKTRQQVDPELQEKSMWKATIAIVKQGGLLALLAGLGPTALGYLLEGGVKFGIYEVSKPVTKRLLATIAALLSLPGLNSQVICLILCGLVSGTAASLMLSPMEALRIRMVSDSEYAGRGSVDAMSLMIRREGVASVCKGLPAMLLKQVPYTITKNCSFDIFTMWAYRMWRDLGYSLTANVKIAVPLVSAIAAAVLSCISSHPGDMLLSLVNAHEGPKRTRDFAKEIMQGENGARGFFIGIKPRFLHVILIVTVQLMIYDFVKRLVGIAATGLG
jgi:solute carrier family 25 phosphate transporter 3